MRKIYMKLVVAGLLLTVLVSIFSGLGVILEVNDLGMVGLQAVAFGLSALAILLFMLKKDGTLQLFAFKKGPVSLGNALFMLGIVALQPVVFGFDFSSSPRMVLAIVVQMCLVAFVEESLFRAIFFFYLREKPKFFIVFSSSVFGFLHVASAIHPEFPLILVSLQVVNALLLGLVFALLFISKKSIYPTMLLHALFNILASLSLEASVEKNILVVGVLLLLYLVYSSYLVKKIIGKRATNRLNQA